MFGQVKILRPKPFNQAKAQKSQPNQAVLQFSTDLFTSFSLIQGRDTKVELGIYWTSAANTDYNFDWSQTFECPMLV